MLIFFLILILILPGSFFPVAMKISLSSSELYEMGVYLEDSDLTSSSHNTSGSTTQTGTACLRTSPST
jgi:hypothetical protein